jgi:hypothetical protein
MEGHMIRLAVAVALVAAFLPGTAAADREPIRFQHLFGIINGQVVVPPDWDGIWTVEDSTYDCFGLITTTSSSTDTLCSGQVIVDPDEAPILFDCSGTATETTIDVTCSASQTILPDCALTFAYTVNGTRTGDSYFMVTTNAITYDGSGLGCDLLPDLCTQTNSHGTRTGPAPSTYCATPAVPATWGGLKVRYR